MSASDNLSRQLFHGTNKTLYGDTVLPTKQRGDEWEGQGPVAAFASPRIDVAAEYGEHVYEVHPTGSEEHVGTDTFMDESGFKIKRKVSPEEIEHHINVVGPKIDAERDLAHRKWLGRNNMEHWSYEGENKYHVRYDKEGNEYKTLLKKGQLRPGDPVKE